MSSKCLTNNHNAIKVQKLPIPVKVYFAETDGICETLEGNVAYKKGTPIMTGVLGEQWPIQPYKFEATYEPIAPTMMWDDGFYVKKPIQVLAVQLTEPMEVTAGWRKDPIQGNPGDWLVQYGTDDFGIVAKDVFSKSYKVLGCN
jgi:hypothetical protein